MQREVEVGGLHTSACGEEALRGVLQHQGVGTDAVERQFLLVDGDGDFLVLLAHHAHVACFRKVAQAADEVHGVIVHLAVGLVGRLHGDEQRRSAAEVINDGDGQHTRREFHRFGLVDLVPDLCPCRGVIR